MEKARINSKEIKKNDIFFAIKGHKLNGENFIDQAIKKGASLIVCSSKCKFKSKNIAGVGVIFYLLIATRHWLRKKNYFSSSKEPRLDNLLSLVALGTIADLVPLDFNNRRLVFQGLKRFKNGFIPTGLTALLKISDLQSKKRTCREKN